MPILKLAAALVFAAAAAESSPNSERVAIDSSGEAHSRRLPASATLDFDIPLAGSLGPIHGRVTGLTNPQEYIFCVYLSSFASGVELVNGPKPFEDDGSSSPIDATGNFWYNTWWANDVYDVVVPTIHGFVWPIASGNCIPILGVPVPGGLLNSAQALGSAATKTYARVNQVAISQVEATGNAVSGTVVGLPTDASARPLSALLYGMNDAWQISGPLQGCVQSSSVPLRTNGNTGTFLIPCGAACAEAPHLIVVIVATTTPLCADDAKCFGICINNAQPLNGAALPPGVSGPSIAHINLNRAVPSQSPSPSSYPSSSPESELQLALPSASSTATQRIVTVTVTVTVKPSPKSPPGGFAIQDSSGASQHVLHTSVFAAAFVAVVALALAPYAM